MTGAFAPLARLARRLVRGPAAARLLAACGIDPPRFWLLFDLFGLLGRRQEVTLLGAELSLGAGALMLFILCALGSVVGLVSGASPTAYLIAYAGFTAVVLVLQLVSEVADNLVNPIAERTLAHQPINAATWSASKLAHLLKVVVYYVAGMNGVPAAAGAFLPHADWTAALSYSVVHLLATLTVGVVAAFVCCSLFGWLVRFVPVSRLKRAAVVMQVLPLIAFWGGYWVLVPGRDLFPEDQPLSIELPAALRTAAEAAPGGLGGLLGAVGAVVALAAVVSGLRALSSDRLLRVAGLMGSGVGPRRRPRRRGRRLRLPAAGPWVARLAGGPGARAGYEYVRALAVRDWQFLRQFGASAAGMLAMLVAGTVLGREPSPFDPGDGVAAAHVLPHGLGLAILIACRCLAFGNDYKAAWALAAAPDSVLRPFAAGVHAALWLRLVAAPHLVWLLVFGWFWGLEEAAGFAVFSGAVASLYLAGSLRLVDGLPFGRRPPADRMDPAMGLYIGVMVIAALSVGAQFVLFRFPAAVAVLTLVVAVTAYMTASLTLPSFAARIQSNLLSDPSGSLFRSVYTDEE